ncbi:MAG TPA: hypothetical protein VM165_04180 [Planctomycetaceae bacterium]|nr:hypothetical protein [Planctomycetaceae bacterium]
MTFHWASGQSRSVSLEHGVKDFTIQNAFLRFDHSTTSRLPCRSKMLPSGGGLLHPSECVMPDMRSSTRDSKRTEAAKSDTVHRDLPKEVQDAVELLRRRHEQGRELAGKFPKYERLPGPDESSALWYETEGFTNDDSARKVRQFVDPKRGYTEKELGRLIRLCEKHERALGSSFVIRLLSVPKENHIRRRLESQLIREGWSMLRLNQELLSLFGRRRRGGEKRQVPADVSGMLSQLDQMALNWLRWTQRAGEATADETTLLATLPRRIQEKVKVVAAALEKLRELIGAAAKASRQGSP